MDKNKTAIAFAEAIAQTLWLKGLITLAERDKINENSRKKLQTANAN